MQIIHLSTTDYGGAYVAAERISRALCKSGVNSKVLVRTKTRNTSECECIFRNRWESFLSKCKNAGNFLLSDHEIVTDYLGTNVSGYQEVIEADVIILHWVNSFISYRGVKQLLKLGKPIIWVMHDMWLFTGGCHCDWYCGKYELGCQECPLIHNRLKKAIPGRNVINKKKMFNSGIIRFVGPSKWLTECAGQSRVLKGEEIRWIANPLDTQIFRPLEDKAGIRKKYQIDSNKKVILFGAVKLEEQNKGIHYLIEALQKLDTGKIEYEIVMFGSGTVQEYEGFCVRSLGVIQEEEKLAEVYNLADVFVAPSQQESFGYTVCEALSCGVPVSAFAVGGYLDQIIPGENGCLAASGDVQALAEGIEYCIAHHEEMTKKARKRVVVNNDEVVIGLQYRRLCEEILEMNNKIVTENGDREE